MRQILSAFFSARIITLVALSSSGFLHATTSVRMHDTTMYQVVTQNGQLCIEHTTMQGELLKMVGSCGGSICQSASLAVQPDGKLVVAALLQDTPTPTLSVMRYLPTSLQPDTTFAHRGIILLDVMRTDQPIIPIVSVNHDGTIVLLDAADNHSVGCLTAQGRVMRVGKEHDLVDLQMTRASGDCTTGTTGVLTVDKIFCYEDCAPVIFGHRGGVRVMITKKGNQVIEEPLCTQILNEDLGDVVLTVTDFQALISGCTACCDTTGTALTEFQQTWTMLAALEAMLNSKFAQTWTMLADLDATQEFQELFTAIKQDTAILCEKFMETWTILYALNHLDVVVTVSSTVDFSTLFTAIVQTTEFLSEKFMETWTIEVFVDPSELFTAIAENNAIAHQNFQETWTVIAALQTTLCDKFQETWTAIDGVAATLTTNFQETWTMLDAVQTSLGNDFDGVFTVIQDIETDIIAITVTQVNEFIITVSILNKLCTEIIDTLTLINEIVLDIQDTFTALNQTMLGKFQETWTALIQAQDNVIAVKDAQTVLFNQDFAGTWTLIAGIDATLTEKFQETWTALAIASPCGATPLYNATTISVSGTYCLANNITGTITIAVDNVILDLNGYQVTVASGDAIAASGLSNITIRNGYISGATATNAIHITDGINILIDRVACTGTGTANGVLVDGAGVNKCITIQNSTFLTGDIGIDINPTLASQVVIQDCYVRGYATAGIRMVSCNSVSVARCMVTNNGLAGMLIQGCNNLVIDGCTMSNQTAGIGIRFQITTSTDIVVQNNIIKNNLLGSGIQFTVIVSRIVINNNQISGNTSGGITVAAALNDATIIGNTISGNTGSPGGIELDAPCSRIVIEENEICGNTGGGIYVGTALANASIRNNLISGDTGFAGLTFDSAISSNVAIEGNTITNNAGGGIQLVVAVNDIVISNNTIFSNSGAGAHGISFIAASRSIMIENNQIFDNELSGLEASAGLSQSSIVGNQIMGNGSSQVNGINLAGTSTTLCIENNCIARHTGVGIAAVALTNSVIKNNEITANVSDGVQITGASNDNAIEGNSITGNGGDGIELSSGTGVTISKFLIGGNMIAGNVANGITVTPTAAVTVIFEKSTISNNIISNNAIGINLAATTGTLTAQQLCIDANCITGNSSHGINNTALNSIFSNNRSFNNGGSGIVSSSGATSCTYNGNMCNNNTSSGIVNAASKCVFDNNECSSNTGSGLVIGTATGTTPINCTASYNICNSNTVDGIQIASGTNAATVLDHAICKNICNKNGAWGINKLGFTNSCSFVLNQCHRNGSAPNFSATISTNFISTYVAATGMMVSKVSTFGSEYTNLSIV